MPSPPKQNALAGLLAPPRNALADSLGGYARQKGLLSSSTLGYSVREPYDSENQYFYQNQHVGGMAGEDGRVVLNPFSPLSPQERAAVALNEAYRLHMRETNYKPTSSVAPDQAGQFAGTAYGQNGNALRQTLLARLLSGDPSAKATKEQKSEAEIVKQSAMRGMIPRLIR